MFPLGHRVIITGRRTVRGYSAEMVRSVLHTILKRLWIRHPEGIVAVCGMAVGADAEFAEAALALGIPLVAAVPVEDQSRLWPIEAQRRYARFIHQASLVVEVWKDPAYAQDGIAAQMKARNRWMLDNSDTIVAVWEGQRRGGTWDTIRGAFQHDRKVLVVDPATGSMRIESPSPPDEEPDPTDSMARWHDDLMQKIKELVRTKPPIWTMPSFINPPVPLSTGQSWILDYQDLELKVLDGITNKNRKESLGNPTLTGRMAPSWVFRDYAAMQIHDQIVTVSV